MPEGTVTAVLASPDTAPSVEETPPAVLGETEIVSAAPGTETGSANETTETEDPLATFDEATLKASPRLKALLEATTKDVEARKEESFRQKSEAQQKVAEEKATRDAYAAQLAQVDAEDRGAVLQTLYETFDSIIDPDMDPDARERLTAKIPTLQAMAQTIQQTTRTRIDRQYVNELNAVLQADFPNYRVPPDDVSKFDSALARGEFKERFRMIAKIIQDATKEREIPSLREGLVKELKAEQETEQKLDKDRQAEASSNVKPTTVSGRPAAIGNYRNLNEVAAAHVRGELTNTQVLAYRAMTRSQMPEF